MKRNVRLILLVFSLAAILRLAYLFENASSPLFSWPVLDEQSLDSQGQEIASGRFSAGPDCFRAPLYPIFLGTIYSISPDNRFFLLRVVQHFLGALTCLLVLIVAAEAFGRRAGIAAGLLAACYAPMIFFEGTILTETLFIFLIALCLACLVLGISRSRSIMLLAGGLALGFAAVTRPNILPFAPAALAWVAILPAAGGWRRRLIRAGLVLAPLVLVISVVTMRNYMATGDFVMISSQGGANFYLGNTPGADGMPPPTRMVYGTTTQYRDGVETSSAEAVSHLMDPQTAHQPAAVRQLQPVSPSDVSSACYKAAVSHIRNNTGAWLVLMARKFVLFWNDFEIRNVKDFYFWRESSFTLSAMPITFGTLAVLGLFGALATARRLTPGAILVNLYVVTFMAGIILFFVCARLRLPVIVGLFPLAGAGIVAVADTITARSWRKFAGQAVVLLALGLFAGVDWYGIRSYNYAQEHWLVGKRLYDLGEYDRAMESFQASMRYDDSFTGNYFFIGNCHWQKQDFDKAKACYDMVLKKDPVNPQALNALGAYAEHKGLTSQAKDFYLKSIESAPGYAKPKTNLGFILLRESRTNEAKRLFTESRRLHEGDPETWLGLALCSALEGDVRAAAASLEMAESLGGSAEYADRFRKMLDELGRSRSGG